jgi:apolipoprotein N-acyltransferase
MHPANETLIKLSGFVSLIIRTIQNWGLVFVAGSASVLAFAPFNLWWLAPLTLSVLFRSWLTRPHQRGVSGFTFGLGLFLVGVHWIYISLHDHGDMPAILAILSLLGFSCFVALLPAIAGLSSKVLGRHPNYLTACLALPTSWTLIEWSRTWFCTGFPWLAFGYSQVPHSPLAGWIPILGVFGASLLCAIVAGAIAHLSLHFKTIQAWLGLGVLSLCLYGTGALLQQHQWTKAIGNPTSIAIMQGNISQDDKFDPKHIYEGMQRYAELANANYSSLIVMPESAVPLLLSDVPDEYIKGLRDIAIRNHGDILLGVFDEPEPGHIHNTMMSLGVSPTQHYLKHHLVPFGEFIPLESLIGPVMNFVLRIPIGSQSFGPLGQGVMKVSGQKIGMDICYEDAFGEEIITALPEATLLINVSNDAWFGTAMGPEQHLQMAQTRALETGRPMVRATSTGVSAFIAEDGRIIERAERDKIVVLERLLQGREGATPFVVQGNLGVVILCLISCLIVAILRHKNQTPRSN